MIESAALRKEYSTEKEENKNSAEDVHAVHLFASTRRFEVSELAHSTATSFALLIVQHSASALLSMSTKRIKAETFEKGKIKVTNIVRRMNGAEERWEVIAGGTDGTEKSTTFRTNYYYYLLQCRYSVM